MIKELVWVAKIHHNNTVYFANPNKVICYLALYDKNNNTAFLVTENKSYKVVEISTFNYQDNLKLYAFTNGKDIYPFDLEKIYPQKCKEIYKLIKDDKLSIIALKQLEKMQKDFVTKNYENNKNFNLTK